ncbi:MAG TPA: transketolase C-terminal domain-containing protein [Limnochordia bacterium]|nr:transketolase C-terminal domain-containing protein [Limnochordia bacterium]
MTATIQNEPTAMIALREAWGDALVELCDLDPAVLVLDGDLANSTKADKVAQQRPERFLEMGIAEQNMIGVAAGLATLGYKPWISTFATFLVKRAIDQIRMCVAQTLLPVRLVGSYSGLLAGFTGKTHISVEDLAVMRAMPNVVTVAPADANELRAAMFALNDHPGPVYMRITRDPSPVIFPGEYAFRLGRAVELRTGADIALVATGVQTTRALAAADLLAAEGIAATVLHVPCLKPLDIEALVRVAERTNAIVTAEDHSIIGGLGGAVAEALAEHRPTRLKRVGLSDTYAESGPNDALLEKYGLTARHVANAAKALLGVTRRG